MDTFHLCDPGRELLLAQDILTIELVCKAWKLVSRQRKSMPLGKKYRSTVLHYYKCLTIFPDMLHVDAKCIRSIFASSMKILNLTWNRIFNESDHGMGKSGISNALTPLFQQYTASGNNRLLHLTSLTNVQSWGQGLYGEYQERYKKPCKFSMTRDQLTLNDVSAGYMRDIVQLWRKYICLSGTITIKVDVGGICVGDYFFAACNYLSKNTVGPDLLVIDARSKVKVQYDVSSYFCLDGLKHVKRIEIWTTYRAIDIVNRNYDDNSFTVRFVDKYQKYLTVNETLTDVEFYDLMYDSKSWLSLVYKPL